MSEPRYILEITGPDGQPQGMEMSEGRAVIGRSKARAQVVVDDPKVSGQHAEIVFAGGKITVKDLGSTNGTLFDGEAQSAAFQLTAGVSFNVGNTTIRLMAIHGLEEPAEKTTVMAPPWLQEDNDDDMESTRALDASQLAALTGGAEEADDSQVLSLEAEPPMVEPEPDSDIIFARPAVEDEPETAEPEPADPPEANVVAPRRPEPQAPVPAVPGPAAPQPTLGAPFAMTAKQQQALAEVVLLPGETIMHIWEGDGFFAGNNPLLKLFALVMRLVVAITGGHIRVYMVLTDQRMLFAESTRWFCGWTRFRLHNTYSAQSIKKAAIIKDTQMCCIHSRLISVSSMTRTHAVVVRKLSDADTRAFLNIMSQFIRANFRSI